jgi:hypothetical protein
LCICTQVWEGDYEGADMLSNALVDASGSKEPLAQGRCSGFGGGFKAVKVKKGGYADEEHSIEKQAKAERKEMDLVALERELFFYAGCLCSHFLLYH